MEIFKGGCVNSRSEKVKQDVLGKVFSSKSHGDFVVIEYVSYNNTTVKFLDTGYITKTAIKEIKNGQIKDPYFPKVSGVGFIGEGVYSARSKCETRRSDPAYEVWSGIFKRCYNKEYQHKCNRYTYDDCSVDPHWHNFQNFAEWFYSQPNHDKGFHVDKDLRKKGNRIYSENTCSLVPLEVNSLFTGSNKRINPRNLPVGIHFCNTKKLYIAQLHRGELTASGNPKQSRLGQYKTKDAALMAYKVAKEERSKQLAEKYKDVLHTEVYSTLMTFEVPLITY
jgi:hypothetical protein